MHRSSAEKHYQKEGTRRYRNRRRHYQTDRQEEALKSSHKKETVFATTRQKAQPFK